MNPEIVADIRNKLQPAVTVLEMVRQGKSVPKSLVDAALKDLDNVLGIIDSKIICPSCGWPFPEGLLWDSGNDCLKCGKFFDLHE